MNSPAYVIVCALLFSGLANASLYSGYQLFQSFPKTATELRYIQRWTYSKLHDQEDMWKQPVSVGDSSLILAKGSTIRNIKKKLSRRRISGNVIIRDINRKLTLEKQDRAKRKIFMPEMEPETFTFYQYHNYSEILYFYEAMQRKHPNAFSTEVIGKSYNQENITLVKVSKPSNKEENRKAIFIEGGIHSREWVSHAATLFMLSQILSLINDTAETEVGKLFQQYDWFILPVANPDGYIFTWDCDRFWRKSRSVSPVVEAQCEPMRFLDDNNSNCFHCVCIGADINRNFNIGWGTIEFDGRCSQQNHCCTTYEGTEPFSESETLAIANFVRKKERNIEIYIGIHAFSQMWMWPYAFNESQPGDWEKLVLQKEISINVTQKMFDVNGTKYRYGAAHEMLYRASGTSMDWVRGKTPIPYAFGVELRPDRVDQDFTGFMLPSEQIIPTSKELFAGLTELLKCINKANNAVPYCTASMITAISVYIVTTG